MAHPTVISSWNTGHRCFRIAIGLFLLCPLAETARAADQKQPTTRFTPAQFPLANMPQGDGPHLLPLDIPKRFPAFQHEPFESSGFNAVALPFRYVEEAKGGDPDEANAFAFLLSNGLDWAPGNYSARHAYFIFKRSAPVLEPFRTEYHRRHIELLVRDWHATHAIGGELVHKEAGYSGTLEIYNHQARKVHRVAYDEPRGY